MIRIKIASEDHRLEDADESWITQQIGRRQREGQLVCVQVTIDEPDVHLRLHTPACTHSGGGTRRATRQERDLLDLWDRLGLNRPNFSGGQVVAFVKQLRRAI